MIEKNILAVATCDLKSQPNLIVVTSRKVVGKDKILITDNCFIKTRKNLLENSKIALAVCSKDEEEAYQFKGTAQYLTQGKWKKMVDEDPQNKDWPHKAAVLVTVNEIWDLAKSKLISKK